MHNSPAVVLMDDITVDSGTNVYGVPYVDLFDVYDLFTAHFVVSGFTGSGTLAVDVEGSLDGEHWYILTNIPFGTSDNTDVFHTSDGDFGSKPARFVRAYAVQFSETPSATVNVTVFGKQTS